MRHLTDYLLIAGLFCAVMGVVGIWLWTLHVVLTRWSLLGASGLVFTAGIAAIVIAFAIESTRQYNR